jgi:two-component sensor histidine kinase
MRRCVNILTWRSRKPALVSWGGAILVFVIAFFARLLLGGLHGANPGLTFYPAVLLASVFLGWKEALLVLFLSVSAGVYVFLPPELYLLPVGWTIVGGLNIAIIEALIAVAQELAAANERQRILFQELQHRVANTLQAVVGTLGVAKRRAVSSPAEAVQLIDDATRRFVASADVHRRLSDPQLFCRTLESILQDAVFAIIDHQVIRVSFDVQELDLTYDQMSIVTMLVVEMANNSQKHVFRHGHGSRFSIELKAIPGRRAMLRVRDDGPGISDPCNAGPSDQALGSKIIKGLTSELRGTHGVKHDRGTEVVVEFPIVDRASPIAKPLSWRRLMQRALRER